jgi:hypothetical protein
MDTQPILPNAEQAKVNTIEFKMVTLSKTSENESTASNDGCSNGVCCVTWKPCRTAAA